MEYKTIAGNYYTITSKSGCSVTDATGTLSMTVDAGGQLTVQAPSDKLVYDDEQAIVFKANFKQAALALGLLGGGKNDLPSGYTRVEFLENTGTQYLALPVEYGQNSGLSISYKVKPYTGYGYLSIIRYSGKSVQIGRISGDGNTGIATSSPTVSVFVANTGKITTAYNAYERGKIKVASPYEEQETDVPHMPAAGKPVTPVYLMAYDKSSNIGVYNPSEAHYSLYEARFTLGQKLVHKYVPSLTPDGEPCMFDLVSKQPFRNVGSGQFVAGIGTVAQLTALLHNLPATGGKLTLSLPAEANTPEVADMLQASHDTKGWTLTVREYRPAAAATYSLRRVREVVWCRRELSDLGSYVDAAGYRWQIDRCVAIFGRHGNDPDAYCYTPFDSVEQAVEFWEMVPYVSPEELSIEA